MSITEELDRLIEQIDTLSQKASMNAVSAGTLSKSEDVLDVLSGVMPRKTKVESLMERAEVQEFRNDLIHGIVRTNRLNQVLRLLTVALELVAGRLGR